MNWFKRLKFAMPLATTSCPYCNASILVDVKQRTTTLKSDPYAAKETGKCITRCAKCSNLMLVIYNFDFAESYFANGKAVPINEDEAFAELSNGTLQVASTLE